MLFFLFQQFQLGRHLSRMHVVFPLSTASTRQTSQSHAYCFSFVKSFNCKCVSKLKLGPVAFRVTINHVSAFPLLQKVSAPVVMGNKK